MSSYLHGQREALKTQCWEQTKTQNKSKKFRKRYSLITQQFSVQYSTMQISFIHMLNIHFFFFFFWKQTVTVPTAERKKKRKIITVLTVCFIQTETLNHAPLPTASHSQTSPGVEWKYDKKVESVQWLGIVQKSTQWHHFQNSLDSSWVFT